MLKDGFLLGFLLVVCVLLLMSHSRQDYAAKLGKLAKGFKKPSKGDAPGKANIEGRNLFASFKACPMTKNQSPTDFFGAQLECRCGLHSVCRQSPQQPANGSAMQDEVGGG